LARHDDVPAAIRTAKAFVTAAIEAALPLGGGHGPVNPMHGLGAWRPARNTRI
ncbi:MAG TPA: bifunctional hydroxymethylpyrimidine kinase/phosphomethylpyrimidine kinase, partial [bacterium]|nr:bifunctional hydroxymethylpyrimidine kinase/phosphomethylpyrimidine kinase [bacterium]